MLFPPRFWVESVDLKSAVWRTPSASNPDIMFSYPGLSPRVLESDNGYMPTSLIQAVNNWLFLSNLTVWIPYAPELVKTRDLVQRARTI